LACWRDFGSLAGPRSYAMVAAFMLFWRTAGELKLIMGGPQRGLWP
jgi:hypothetical protein